MPAAPRPLHLLALPLVASFTLRFAFGMVDLVYASSLPDKDAAVAAISLYMPFQEALIALWVGLSAGFTAALSAAFGRRDESHVQALQHSVRRLLLVAVPILAALGGSLWFVVPAFDLAPDLTGAFRTYGTTMLIGMPLTSFWSVYPDSVVKAHHDTRTTMLAGMSATLTNVALNTTFVFVFHWGLFGIALATVLSRLVALVWASRRAASLERARRAEPDWQLSGAAPPPRRALAEVVGLGLPSTLAFALTAAESGLAYRLLADASNSTVAIASYGVFYQLQRLALMPTVASAVAVLPFVARRVPEGHHAAVARDLRKVAVLAAGCSLLFTIPAGVLFPSAVGGFFVRGESAAAVGDPLTRQLLLLLPLSALAMLPFLLLRSVFEALQRPRLGIGITLVRFVVLSYPLLVAGWHAAEALGAPPPVGMVCGFITAGAIASTLTVIAARRTLHAAAERA